MSRPIDVDTYIASAPNKYRHLLKKLRAAIKEAAPDAIEKISYGMPYYHYNGRLAYFRLATNHIGLYIPGSAITAHKKELKTYSTTSATIRLPLNQELPISLIKTLVKEHAKENEKKG